ncbi:MAG: hypothetical protein LBT65_03450, partial [Synergistaceae bacterium]|nr:hypothetical protein [Synergistaceae bacterium]
VKIILSENERLRGNRITCNSYKAAPPGNLKNPWCIKPLIEYVFGEENVSWDRSEPTLYHEDLYPDMVY